MNLAILGAGESSRIKTEGLNKSKLMISIKGEYLVERIIRISRNNDVDKVFCIINSHEPELKNFLVSNNFGIDLKLLIKDTESSMHSLFELAPFIMDAPFILTTSDAVFIEKDFSEFVKYCLLQSGIDGVLAISKYIDDEKPLCVSMNSQNRILKFSDEREGYNWATGGIYFFLPGIFNQMESALTTGISRLRNFLKFLISKDLILKGFPFSKIIDIDHIVDIAVAEKFINSIT